MVFYRALIQRHVHLRGPEVRVTQDLCNVLNRYALADQICCQGPAEPVRVDITHTGAAAEDLNDVFNPLFCETAVRILEPNKQRRIVIGPAAEVTPKVFGTDLGEVEATFFAALPDHGRFTGDEVDTGPVQGYDFGYSEAGGI